MKTTLLFLLISCLLTIRTIAQTSTDSAEQLAASFDKSKIKHKSKYGVQVNREVVTRHEVANVNDLSFYQGHYVGIEGTYEITLTVSANQQITGHLLQPDASGKTQTTPLTDIHISEGLLTANAGKQPIKGVFINQGRVDNGQERISFGLGIINPQLTSESINYIRIFCEKK